MVDIQDLMLVANDDGSNEYKEGWNSAVGYLNDNYIITKRNGEPISITFDLRLDDDELIKKVTKAINNE
jgi:hypothetical protein